MFGQFKTLAAAIVTLLIGASFAESAEISLETAEEQVESTVDTGGGDDSMNVMGDIL